MKMEDFETLFKEIASYLWMICLGVMGGTVNYVSRIRRDSKLKFSIIELLGEWFASGFVALMTAYACLYLEFNFPLLLSCAAFPATWLGASFTCSTLTASGC